MSGAAPPPIPTRASGRYPLHGERPRVFPRYVRKSAARRGWPGPSYLFATQWRNDLVAVMEQVRLCVLANVPLSPGFEMIARDGLNAFTGWSPQRSTRTFKLAAFLFFIGSALLATALSMPSEGPAPVIGITKSIVLCVWCYYSVHRRYCKPMAVFLCLQKHVDTGDTLAEAMARMPRFFPKNLVCLVEAGERTGNLREILEGFNDATIRSIGNQQELARIFRYLALNFLAIALIAFFVLIKSIPVLRGVLEELDPPQSRLAEGILIPVPSLYTLDAVMQYLAVHWYLLPIALAMAGLGVQAWFRRPQRHWAGRPKSAVLLAIPFFRGMVVWQNLGGAARLIRHLLAVGVPLEQCLAMAARGDLHPWYRRWFEGLRQSILNGHTLEEACAKHAGVRLVPQSFGALLAMGERQGSLEESLAWIGEQYHEKLERRTRFLLGCVMPAGVFLLGYIVLTLEASVFHTLILLADALIA